ncbi:glycosyltransferase [Candidatus Woesearchaeota archaeon]|nr:glycosyltransferase [Candidatus Woesearchaeota archaeon]
MKLFFSIIIPFGKADKYLLECVKACSSQSYGKFEIILLPDSKTGLPFGRQMKNIRIIETGKVYPSKKRNIGMKNSKGNMCSFIDSDAFPKKDWLKNSARYFKDQGIAAVGGPNLIPKNEPFLVQLSGMAITNFFATGPVAKRFKVFRRNYFAPELSASNLIVRKSIMEKLNGFDERFLTGEDSKLCRQINESGKKILYARDVQVYHHQRKWPFSYGRQIFTWGRNRGTLVSKKEADMRVEYLALLSFALFMLIGGILSFFIHQLLLAYLLAAASYLSACLIFSFSNGIKFSPFLFISFPLTHFTYSLGFLLGFIGLGKGCKNTKNFCAGNLRQ